MSKFRARKCYAANDSSYDPITVLKRTPKMILCTTNGMNRFRLLIRTDINGDEYVTDSSVPMKWREAFTYQAKYPV